MSLKAIGNLSGNKDNAVRVVQAKFVKNAKKFITKNIEKDKLVKMTLKVMGNVALRASQQAKEAMIKHGFTEAVSTVIQEYELNDKMLKECLHTLDNMVG
jgi:hypothetical protein